MVMITLIENSGITFRIAQDCPGLLIGGLFIWTEVISVAEKTFRQVNSANYTSPRINGINSNTADFNTCTCIQRTTKNKIYVL